MKLAVSIRTANRHPKPNYLRKTLLDLQRSGADLATVQLCPTAPDVRWLESELADLPVRVHVPETKRRANDNGLAQVDCLLSEDAEMVLLLEDDLVFCSDFLGSVSRWLDRHARPDRHVYRCFGFTTPPNRRTAAYDWTLDGLRGSQAIILWRAEAADFVAWGRAHLTDWVPLAPWGRQHPRTTDPHVGFDKFVATWALVRWPGTKCVMSQPYFVKHVGDQSTLHRFGVRNDRPFAGAQWRYEATA